MKRIPLEDLPHPIREIENVWIPTRDRTRLAARLWLPEDAEEHPVPAILEYIPYRKRDIKRHVDEKNHRYFAGHGYACLRVDMRGSGDSEGVLKDEYLAQEQEDGIDVLRWIGQQPWCTGDVGMIGISWGGFNGLQIAARRPPELKTIITVCSTDDRYADDVHYMGGCLLGDNLSWASVMFSRAPLPPDPEIVGDRWHDMWLQRLRGTTPWLDNWLSHQRRDAYWRHGSICEDFSDIQCPVMAVSGWADGYSNAVFRLLENLDVPRLGLIGPWSHRYPHDGVPGPAIGFLQESLRWWDHWLKGEETGIMKEPMLRAYMQDSMPPSTSYEKRHGRWVAESVWPSGTMEDCTFQLEERWLVSENAEVERKPLSIQSPLRLGLVAGKWCSYSAPPDLPGDQREEDGGALVFDSDILEKPMEILGSPVADLEIAADKPVAMIAARLSDIGKDGGATRVTYGVLNLTHRYSHERPEAIPVGEPMRIHLPLNVIAHRFPAGHRIRLAISTSYWPLAWPPPETTRLKIFAGTSRFTLPVRPEKGDDGIGFPEPEGAVQGTKTLLRPEDHGWTVIRDLAADVSTLKVLKDDGVHRLDDINLDVENKVVETYRVYDDDPLSARGEVDWVRGFRRGDWQARVETRTVLTCNRETFILRADLDAFDGDQRIFCNTWDLRIPRDYV